MIRVGVAVFAMRGDGSFLLCKRAEGLEGAGRWSVPGGAVEDDEAWRDTANREVGEEVCLVVPEPHLLAVTTADNWMTIWCAGRCTAKPQVVPDAREVADFEWVTCGDLWKFGLWKTHWTPLLDEIGGTVQLDVKLRGRNN